MATHVVIPARLESTRLPGKPLADIGGKPMLVRVMLAAAEAECDSVFAAVDDAQVEAAVTDAGFPAVMTRMDHNSGSDRVMEVAQVQHWPDDDIVINVQGDEPLIPPQVITQLGRHMAANPGCEMATLCEPITRMEDLLDPNTVKVVVSDEQLALYFSRAPVPYPRDLLGTQPSPSVMANVSQDSTAVQTQWPEGVSINAHRHVGIYAFTVGALRAFTTLPASRFEETEKLEQLRWLQAGRDIAVLVSAEPVPGGVDTPADLERVRALID